MSTTTQKNRLTVEVCNDGNAWDAFIRQQDGSPFALWGWGEAVDTYGLDRRYLVAKEDDTFVGALPLVRLQSRVFGDTLVSLPYTSQGELVAAGGQPAEVQRRLLEEAKRLGDDFGVDVVTIRSTDLGSCQPFVRDNRYVSFQIPVRGTTDDVWKSLSRSKRRHVRKAEENDSLEYVVGDSIDHLEEYYQLYLLSMRAHGAPPHSFEFFRVLWERLHGDGNLRLALIRKDGRAINGVIDLALGPRVIQKGLALDYDYRDLNGGTLLNWKSLEWACEAGYDYYDLGRTRKDTGIYQYKKDFGGDEVDLLDYHYFPSGSFDLPDAEDERYDLPKRLWQKLPLPVTQAIGPQIRKNISL